MYSFSNSYRSLEISKRRNLSTFIWEIVIESVLQMSKTSVRMLTFKAKIEDVQELLVIGTVLSMIYVVELIFRIETRFPLIAHHLTLVAIFLLAIIRLKQYSSPYASDFIIIVFTVCSEGLTAMTEQPIHASLLIYRLYGPSILFEKCMRLSTIWNGVSKLILKVFSLTVLALGAKKEPKKGGMFVNEELLFSNEDKRQFWIVLWPIVLSIFGLTQIWACWIQWNISNRSKAQRFEKI